MAKANWLDLVRPMGPAPAPRWWTNPLDAVLWLMIAGFLAVVVGFFGSIALAVVALVVVLFINMGFTIWSWF